MTQSLRSFDGTLLLFCNVTDLAGNGRVDSGDFFAIEANYTSFDPRTLDELILVYAPTDDPMWAGEFHDGELVRPSEFPWTLLVLAGLACIALIIVLLVMGTRKRPL
ncbi:MAG TPA: hypothetical protein VGB78_05650 [Thermoplasmata archaeon]